MAIDVELASSEGNVETAALEEVDPMHGPGAMTKHSAKRKQTGQTIFIPSPPLWNNGVFFPLTSLMDGSSKASL
jgi:hypothetical protein